MQRILRQRSAMWLLLILQLGYMSLIVVGSWLIHPGKTEAASLPAEDSVADLVAASTWVVRGQVTAQSSHWRADRRVIETDSTVQVRYTLGAQAPAQVVVRTEGGFLPTENLGLYSSHAPQFRIDDEVLLFLRKEGAHATVVQEEVGAFTVVKGMVRNSHFSSQPLTQLYPQIQSAFRSLGRAAALPANWQAQEAAVLNVKAAAPDDFVLSGMRWPTSDPQIHFRVNVNSSQAGGAAGSATDFLNNLIAAGTTWGLVPGAAVNLLYDGPTGATDLSYNGTNEVIFFPAGAGLVAGRARIWFNDDKTILEADLYLNDDHPWNATGSPEDDQLDIQSGSLHEFGHWLGLGHDTDTAAVMYSTLLQGTIKRVLHPNDVAGISFIYPCDNVPCLPPGSTLTPETATPTASATPTPTNSPTPSPTATSTPTSTPTLNGTVPTVGAPTLTLTPTGNGGGTIFLPQIAR